MCTLLIGFSLWETDDLPLATRLWSDEAVSHYITASGVFTQEEIAQRLATEIQNEKTYGYQYWPIFLLETDEFIGCCGLRPCPGDGKTCEFGIQLLKEYWGKGYGVNAGGMAIAYAFNTLHASKLIAGHHPDNIASKRLLEKLGFTFIENRYYPPTGLSHPTYELKNAEY